jgi:hypothetical protein
MIEPPLKEIKRPIHSYTDHHIGLDNHQEVFCKIKDGFGLMILLMLQRKT